MDADERILASPATDWVHEAIAAGAIDDASPYVGINEDAMAKLANSDFAERPLLVRLRSGHGDWRIVKNARWIVAWCAAAEPERIWGSYGVSFGPADIRDVYPLARGPGTAAPL